VREGDRVQAGDLLVRLDDTQTRAMVAIVAKNLDDLTARQARLEAERDGARSVEFSAPLVEQGRNPNSDTAHAITAEQNLFNLRREAREGQRAQLRERVLQLREEIQG